MADATPSVSYCTHIQNIGWGDYAGQGGMSGTEGLGLRLEGIRIALDDAGYDLGIEYQTHIQNIGWESDADKGWSTSNGFSGTEGFGYRLEAIQIKLTGADADQFDIYYRVHAQNVGWMGWAKNGESAGTAGFGYRLEGIYIEIVPAGSAAPGSTNNAFIQISDVERLLNKMNGSWKHQAANSYYIFDVTKTSATTGHMFYTHYYGGGDSMEFDFSINGMNADGTATLIMNMASLKKYGLSPNFTTIRVDPLFDQPNWIVFFQAAFTKL